MIFTPIAVVGSPYRPLHSGGKLDLLVRGEQRKRYLLEVDAKLFDQQGNIIAVFARRRLPEVMERHKEDCLVCERMWRCSKRAGRAWYPIEPIAPMGKI